MAEGGVGEEKLELLRRAIDEVDALQAIYGDDSHDDDDAISSFRVVSHFEQLRVLLEDSGAAVAAADIPQLEIEIRIPIGFAVGEEADGINGGGSATIRFRLPSAYPENAATIALLSLNALRRSYRDEIAKKLNERAADSAASGQEAMLDIIDYLKELVAHFIEYDAAISSDVAAGQTVGEEGNSTSSEWGRRWIWVHHITNTSRCKSIVDEARELNLRGYLKKGYPGVVLIEGNAADCDKFVTFIKGNKSRPGGFGRNWGHHVRGHIEPAENLLSEEFRELGEDLAVLAKICRECLLEEEFKEYILQHKG